MSNTPAKIDPPGDESPIRNRVLNRRARATLVAIGTLATALLVSCYALVTPDRVQCESAEDCAGLAGSTALRCIDHLCVAFPDAGSPDSGYADSGTVDTRAADQGSPDGPVDATLPGDIGVAYPAPPVAYWPFDNADISGTTVSARLGGINGTIVGAVSSDEGRVGQSLSFNGAGDFVTFGDVLDTVFSGPDKVFSISAWVKPADITYSMVVVSKNADTDCPVAEDQRGFYFGTTNAQKVSVVYQTPVSVDPQSIQIVATYASLQQANVWIHLVLVYDGTIDAGPAARVRMYIDGVIEDDVTLLSKVFPIELRDTTAHFAIGSRVSSTGSACYKGGSRTFNGLIDEVAVWDFALTDQEVAGLYSLGVSGRVLYPIDSPPEG